MTSKRYRCPKIIGVITILMTIGLLGVGVFAIWMLLFHSQSANIYEIIMGYLLIGFSIFGLIYILFALLPKAASTLRIKNGQIIWRCPFRKTVKINIEDCKYVGIEDSTEYIKYRYLSQAAIGESVGLGKIFSYIYLSVDPYPKKYEHKAIAAPCKNGFISFMYSDTLCKELIDVLPKKKKGQLTPFYNAKQIEAKLKAKN